MHKNYLRPSTSKERLSGLATIAIENRTAMKLKFEFPNIKAHKVKKVQF
jgi:hypothetical protein